MRNARLDEAQAGIKIARRNINNLRYADDTTLMAETEEESKSLLMKMKGSSDSIPGSTNVKGSTYFKSKNLLVFLTLLKAQMILLNN